MNGISLDQALSLFEKTVKSGQYQSARVNINLETGMFMVQRIGQMFAPDFQIDTHNQSCFEQLFWYFTGQHENFKGDPHKGILAVGQKGTGKTLAMVVMQHMLEFLDKSGQFQGVTFKPHYKLVKCTEIKSEFSEQETGGMRTLKQYKTRHVVFCFDDLGEEIDANNKLAQHYGNQINVMENILTTRAELFKVHRTITHGTSNYPIQKPDGSREYFSEFYGPRVADRAKEMFNTIVFKGESRRK